ncbi:MAG: S8 family serine peptidase [Prochlorothrix sp.]
MIKDSQYGGVPQGQDGLILQRGGEELRLEKAIDRFSFQSPLPPTPSWQDSLGLAQVRPVVTPQAQGRKTRVDSPFPPASLWEVPVEPANLETLLMAVRHQAVVTFASHVYHILADPGTVVYLRDEITVQFGPGVEADRRIEIIATWGLVERSALRGLEQAFRYQVTAAAPVNPLKIANALMTLPEVLLAEPNVVVRQQSHYRPTDDRYRQQWYLYNDGGTDTSPLAHIDIEKAWDLTRGDRSIVVAITDDSVDINHPDFQGLGKVVAPRDLRGQDFLPLPEGEQDNHGTAVAGVAVAEENGSGVVGVAPGCALMPIRTTGFLDDESVEEMFHWAVDQGAAVICCSWGASAVRFPLSLRQRAALTYAATQGRGGKGCVIVFAAGNCNRPLNGAIVERNWPQEVLSGPTQWLNGFGTHPDVITVSACTSLAQKALYSNWGAEVFICAPSNNGNPIIYLQPMGMVRTAPEVTARLRGRGVVTTDRTGEEGYSSGDFTAGFGGTSSAAPVVAGVVALMLSVNPQLTVAQVKAILRESADKIVDANADLQLGLRYGTYEHSGHSYWFGYGKVNAYRAVQLAQERAPAAIVGNRQIHLLQDQPLPLPDRPNADAPPFISRLTVTDAGKIATIAVEINLEHGFLGDLEVMLVPPEGDGILLQPRILGRKTQLQTTYTQESTPILQRLRGRSALGLWQLQIFDRALGASGTLKSWQLTLGLGSP